MSPTTAVFPGSLVVSGPPTRVLAEPRSKTDSPTASWPSDSSKAASSPAAPRNSVVYIVDDMPELTVLYTAILEATGYTVRAFNNRNDALDVLKSEAQKPDLLITDHLGGSMPVGRFICHCRVLHPTLRILMATGLDQAESLITDARPDRFIRKPFTLEELLQKVRSALTIG